MGGIPCLGFWLDGQFNTGIVRPAKFLQAANLDLGDQFQFAIRRLFDVLPE